MVFFLTQLDLCALLCVGAVETLVLWENLDITRYEMKNPTAELNDILYLKPAEESDQVHFIDKEVRPVGCKPNVIRFGCLTNAYTGYVLRAVQRVGDVSLRAVMSLSGLCMVFLCTVYFTLWLFSWDVFCLSVGCRIGWVPYWSVVHCHLVELCQLFFLGLGLGLGLRIRITG